MESWQALKKVIRPVGYGIQSHMMTTMSLLEQSEELPELFMKSGEEIKLWRMLRRLTSEVRTKLDKKSLDQAKKVQAYRIGHIEVVLNLQSNEIEIIECDNKVDLVPVEVLKTNPIQAFKIIKKAVFI